MGHFGPRELLKLVFAGQVDEVAWALMGMSKSAFPANTHAHTKSTIGVGARIFTSQQS
jgi:hypothetical protein